MTALAMVAAAREVETGVVVRMGAEVVPWAVLADRVVQDSLGVELVGTEAVAQQEDKGAERVQLLGEVAMMAVPMARIGVRREAARTPAARATSDALERQPRW